MSDFKLNESVGIPSTADDDDSHQRVCFCVCSARTNVRDIYLNFFPSTLSSFEGFRQRFLSRRKGERGNYLFICHGFLPANPCCRRDSFIGILQNKECLVTGDLLSKPLSSGMRVDRWKLNDS